MPLNKWVAPSLEDINELKNDYSVPEDCEDDDEALDYFRDETMVLELGNGGLVIQKY